MREKKGTGAEDGRGESPIWQREIRFALLSLLRRAILFTENGKRQTAARSVK
ncbi:MAG: hypothetical protein KHW62_00205 [Clostridiales bacterium]|nr:hypothetical protein [Clostridiales bacterium]